MKEAVVCLVNLTPAVNELARHLVLSGINVKLVESATDPTVSQEDVEGDFLYSAEDIGK